MYITLCDLALQDTMAGSNLVVFHSQAYHFIPLQLSPVAYFSIQTCRPQLSIIQACDDTSVSLRVQFIDGAHLQVVAVCCSHLNHLLYLSLLIFYVNY